MIEVGIPFSDPVADGPVIQAAAVRALAAGVRTGGLLRPDPRLSRPPSRTCRSASSPMPISCSRAAATLSTGPRAEAGADSVLVADVPLLEAAPFVRGRARGGDRAGADRRRQHAARAARGGSPRLGARLYLLRRPRRASPAPTRRVRFDHERDARRLRAAGAPPPIFGFGISRPDHVRAALEAGAAGVISGSAIVDLVARGEPVRGFVEAMKAATCSLCTAGTG